MDVRAILSFYYFSGKISIDIFLEDDSHEMSRFIIF